MTMVGKIDKEILGGFWMWLIESMGVQISWFPQNKIVNCKFFLIVGFLYFIEALFHVKTLKADNKEFKAAFLYFSFSDLALTCEIGNYSGICSSFVFYFVPNIDLSVSVPLHDANAVESSSRSIW